MPPFKSWLLVAALAVVSGCSGSSSSSNVDPDPDVEPAFDGGASEASPDGGAISPSGPTDACTHDNGGCGDTTFFKCTSLLGVAFCSDVDECASNNGGCGDAQFWSCHNRTGAAPECADIDECESRNGGCGDEALVVCRNREGAAALCVDVDECAHDNGGCGDVARWVCGNRFGAPALCADLDECERDNGGCGDKTQWSCSNQLGAPALCTDIDECLTHNGGCGDAAFTTCTNQIGASPVCADVDECQSGNGACGHAALFACQNHFRAPVTCLERQEPVIKSSTVAGVVSGLAQGASATVVLGNDGFLVSRQVTNGQAYEFTGVPDGHYFLKVEVSGHAAPKQKRLEVSTGAGADPNGPASLDFATAPLSSNAFSFHWEEDDSRAGEQQTAYVNQPHQIVEVQSESIEVLDLAAAETLEHDYNVVLSADGLPWTQELASRLLETERQIPQRLRDNYAAQALVPSKWVLTQQSLSHDIEIVWSAQGNQVLISVEAFVNAAPKLVLLDGLKGTFFSRRLHHAVTRYVTHDGTDTVSVNKIMFERFGCTTAVPDYSALTAPTTAESASSFQPFHSDELVELINIFEEMPAGYHSVPGLKYLVRRKDGMPHPWYPAAPATAWAIPSAFPNGSYIEFMESAFTSDPDHMHRLILHEKAHFMWGYLFSQEIKDEWISIGGWYLNPQDPDGWSTSKQVEFVSAYAHQKNPNEDSAESLSYFVLDPDALRSRSLPKYEFIRDRIMHGTQYISRIRQDLTFEVLNLFPDYRYPGKIRRIDIKAEGAATSDKQITLEVELNVVDHVFGGASAASLRVFSSIGTYVDVWLAPVNGNGAVLRGSFTLSKYAKSGFWNTQQILLFDQVGNQRMAGVDDFGWRLLVDNPLEDVTPPLYVPGSLQLTATPDFVIEGGVSHPVQRVRATWLVNEDRGMPPTQSCYAALTNTSVNDFHSRQSWGDYDAATTRASVDFIVTEFLPSGVFSVPTVVMVDSAGNRTTQLFSSSPSHQSLVTLAVSTTNPDTQAPEVSLNDDLAHGLHKIQISGTPTHPTAPDGETMVHVAFQARDDKAGVGVISYRLLDPQGISHFFYDYHSNFYTVFFQGDATQWSEYTIDLVLPVGSAPGTWGLQELVLYDKAGNRNYQNFVETMQFNVAQ